MIRSFAPNPCCKSVSNYVDEQKVYKIERNIIHNSKKKAPQTKLDRFTAGYS
jgi:hypothetical protein